MRNRVIGSIFLFVAMLFLSTASFAQVRVSVRIAPPELETYEQPIAPGDGYIWTPGYWAYDDDYYWVPGEWVLAPEPGYLWTPGYWGWGDDGYFFNEGYWGTEVGFYGGINYGFGYFGHGFEGGRWQGGRYFNNSSVNRVNGGSMHDTFNERVNVGSGNRVSFNGGNGGVNAALPLPRKPKTAARGRHISASSIPNATHASRSQRSTGACFRASRRNFRSGWRQFRRSAHRRKRSSGCHGKRPSGVNGSSEGLACSSRAPAAPNSGNAKTDQKYQKQQDKLVANQTKERQNLQQKQDNEHQQLTRQKAPPAKTQQVEQQHEQQTRQMQQTHAQQTQQMQQRQAPPASRGGGSGRGHEESK